MLAYTQVATQVGQWIGEHQGQLVYGGGSQGLMGTVARSAKSAGANVVGVIPHALAAKETANESCDELHMVDNMHQRKFMMAQSSSCLFCMSVPVNP